jgi:hypothetical protein
MSGYTTYDSDVVRGACKRHGINYRNHVTMGDKLKLKDCTGLSVSKVAKAITYLRKSFR